MRLGDRVKTHKFGMGTVIGFEVLGWHKSWLSSTPDMNDRLQRIVVALDDPKAWICANERNPHPYMMQGDIEGCDFLPPMAEPRKTFTLPAAHKVELAPFMQMPKPTPLPDVEYPDTYARMFDTMQIVARRMAVLAALTILVLLYFK